MKRATTTKRKGLENSPEQMSTAALPMAKYLIIRWRGREQVVSFSFRLEHAEMLRNIRQECGDVEALSAGYYIISGPGALWHGGEADALNLRSRPQDRELRGRM